jgi:hypothetical protein
VSVGEVFEVMTQADHVLTLVNKFDRQLRLIKNLGRDKWHARYNVVMEVNYNNGLKLL